MALHRSAVPIQLGRHCMSHDRLFLVVTCGFGAIISVKIRASEYTWWPDDSRGHL